MAVYDIRYATCISDAVITNISTADRSKPLFYFVPEDFHIQAASTISGTGHWETVVDFMENIGKGEQ